MAAAGSSVLLARGLQQLAAGDLRAGIEDCEAALASLPQDCPGRVHALSATAAAYLQLRQADPAARLAREAVEQDGGSVEARSALASAVVASGDFRGALALLSEGPSGSPDLCELRGRIEASEADFRLAGEEIEAGDHASALARLRALEDGLLFDAAPVVAGMGACHLALGDLSRVQNITASLLRRDPTDVAALMLRAQAQFQSIEHHIDSDAWAESAAAAMSVARQALSLDPDSQKAVQLRRGLKGLADQVGQARAAFSSGDLSRAEAVLTAILGSKPSPTGKFAARCLAERGRARLEKGDLQGCVADCQQARRMDIHLRQAYTIEARGLQLQERWDEAVTVLENLHEWHKDVDTFWKVEWAKFEVRRVRRPDYYDILATDTSANLAAIKKKYREMSVEHHPDKVRMRNPGMDPQAADEHFKMIGEAYEILGDQAKRDLYDKGYDAQGIREVLAVRKRCGGQSVCCKCGEDEPGKLGTDGRWYCSCCWASYYRDKPAEEPSTAPADHAASAGAAPAGPAGAPAATPAPRAAGAWPEGEPLPSGEQVRRMGVAELKGVLAEMGSDAAGCLTKEDLRARALDLLQRRGGPAQEPAEAGLGSSSADRASAAPPEQAAARAQSAAAEGAAAPWPGWSFCVAGGPWGTAKDVLAAAATAGLLPPKGARPPRPGARAGAVAPPERPAPTPAAFEQVD